MPMVRSAKMRARPIRFGLSRKAASALSIPSPSLPKAAAHRKARFTVRLPFLQSAIAYYASLGVSVTRVMTDNGSCYRSRAFRNACRELGLRHIRTRPYTPKTNGKAERFIRPRCANGHTQSPTQRRSIAPPSCPFGCIATIGIAHTAA
jgi:hypothetical protein